MKRVSVFGRLAVWPFGRLAVGLTCALWGWSAPHEARAGEWISSVEYVGSSSGTFAWNTTGQATNVEFEEAFSFDWVGNVWTDQRDDFKHSKPWFENAVPVEYGNANTSPRSVSTRSNVGAGVAEIQGAKAKIKWTWTRTAQEIEDEAEIGPVPPVLIFKVMSQASSAASSASASASESATRDKAGEEVTASISPGNAKESRVSDDTSTRLTMQGKDLYTRKTDGNPEVEMEVTFSAKGSISGNRKRITPRPYYQPPMISHTIGAVSASISASTSLDTRSVKISRAGAVGEWVDSDGTTHGDTTYSHYNRFASGRKEALNILNFSATLNGGWSQNILGINSGGNWITWNWVVSGDGLYFRNESPAEADGMNSYDRWNQSSRAAKTGNLEAQYAFGGGTLEKWVNGDGDNTSQIAGQVQALEPKSPTEVTIKYFVRDNGDGAEAEARYKLGIHEPIERIGEVDRKLISYVTDYFKPDGTLLMVHHPNLPGGTHEITNTTSSGWSLTGTIAGIEQWAIPIGVEVGYQWSKENSFTEVAPQPVNANNDPIKPGPGEVMYIRIKHTYNRHHSFFWKYNEAGKERRWASPPGPGEPDPGVPIEVPHEAIWDVFRGDTMEWSKPTKGDDGLPEPGDPQESLPAPSYKYSQKEKSKHAKPLG